MKKILAAVICLAMAIGLCACGSTPGAAETVVVPTPAESAAPAPETAAPAPETTPEPAPAVDMQAETDALVAALEQIDAESRPGSAGSSLTAVRIAADFLNWAAATKLTPEQISELTAQWLTDKQYGAQSEFNRKLDDVYYAYQSLIAEGSADLMSSAGVDYPEGTWGYEPVPAIEAVESAVGPSDMVF